MNNGQAENASGRASAAMAGFDAAAWRRRLRVAQGQDPADLVLAGGDVVDVFAGDTYQADVAIADGVIAGVGSYPRWHRSGSTSPASGSPRRSSTRHVHTESALVWLPEFARAVVPHGTGAVVTDPHEIANVAGLPGMEAMRGGRARTAARHLLHGAVLRTRQPLGITRGGLRTGRDRRRCCAWPESVGLGELMNFPGVLAGDDDIAAKLAVSAGRTRATATRPGLRGAALQAYVGSGPGSDHESTTLDEAREKLRAGQMVMIREGSSARNMHALLPLVTDATYPRCCFCSDDRDVHTLLHDGHMDVTLRQAIALGLDPVRAIRMATWNTADYWRLDGWGAVAPGFRANLVVLDDLREVRRQHDPLRRARWWPRWTA